MDFVEICNVYIGKVIIKAAKRIFNSVKICHSYTDLNFGVTCFGTQCMHEYIVMFVTLVIVDYMAAPVYLCHQCIVYYIGGFGEFDE